MWQSQSILSRALHFKTALYDIYYAHLNLGMLGPETILLTNNVLKDILSMEPRPQTSMTGSYPEGPASKSCAHTEAHLFWS